TVSGCLSGSTGSGSVTVNLQPSAKAGTSLTICNGGSVSIGATAVSGDTYSWISNPSGFGSKVSNPSVTPSGTTIYTLTDTITDTGCNKSDSVKITVNPLPSANAGSDNTICKGASASIGASAVSGNTY